MFLHKDFMPYVVALYRQSVEDSVLKETIAAATSITKALNTDKEITSFLNISFIPFEEKINVLTTIISNKNLMFIGFLTVLGQSRKLKFLDAILRKFLEYADHKSGIHHVHVISTFDLTAKTQKVLQTAIETQLKTPVKLFITVDSSLIGGIVIRYHHHEIDLSLKSTIFSLKSNLKELYS